MKIVITKFYTLMLVMFGSAALCFGVAQQPDTFADRVASIMARPLYRHAIFGIELYSLDKHESIFELNAKTFFTPASTTKLLTEGTALALLGQNYRFRTDVYRTGPVINGTLEGDLILLASGDPNLSDRVQSNDGLTFENHDHSYGGSESKGLPGDPLKVMREFADQIAAKGITTIAGHVIVDISLFPEGVREQGSSAAVISPIVVNDNIIDVFLTPGSTIGAPCSMRVSPEVPQFHFVNSVVTEKSTTYPRIARPELHDNDDGSKQIIVSGTLPQNGKTFLYGFPVPVPHLFAAALLTQALTDRGIRIRNNKYLLTEQQYRKYYHETYLIAEHVSPPLSEDVKITLKVSQNLHASLMPYILGAIIGKATTGIDQVGFDLERTFFLRAGLDPDGASQADGAGGARAAFLTPDFVTHYLAYMYTSPESTIFRNALPILGKDGSLASVQVDSPAAGHVFAKTGTFDVADMLNRRLILTGKGMAGYMTTSAGEHLAFAFYVNGVAIPEDNPDLEHTVVGEALGELASAAYALRISTPPNPSPDRTAPQKQP